MPRMTITPKIATATAEKPTVTISPVPTDHHMESPQPVSNTSDSNAPIPNAPFPDASLLENRMPEWFRLSRATTGLIFVLGIVYCFFGYRPVYHTDVWGHLAYGRLIAETGNIPQWEPLMPLAEGMPFVDTAWLSQLIGYHAHALFGATVLQAFSAAGITCCLALLCWRWSRRGVHPVFCAIGGVLFLWVEWQSFIVLRPQLAGLVCFMALFTLLTSRQWRNVNWLIVPALFIAWANLHGSFPVGLGLLAMFCVGRAIDVALRCRGFSVRHSSFRALSFRERLAAITRNKSVRRYFLLLELSAVAVLLNPYGWELYAEVFSFSTHPNLAVLGEWKPLTLPMKQGQAVAVVAVLLMLLYRATPRRISASEPLLLIGLGAAMLWTSRMIVWWSPVAIYACVIHGTAVMQQLRRKQFARKQQAQQEEKTEQKEIKQEEITPPASSPSSSLWAVISLGLLWISFACNPFGIRLLHGEDDKQSHRSFSSYTPINAVEFLKEHPPHGQIFNTYEIGDYLLWAEPNDWKIFVMSHAHLVPEDVWQHYRDVVNGSSDWQTILDRYSVNTVVLNSEINESLTARLKRESQGAHAKWRVVFEDRDSIIFVRNQPI